MENNGSIGSPVAPIPQREHHRLSQSHFISRDSSPQSVSSEMNYGSSASVFERPASSQDPAWYVGKDAGVSATSPPPGLGRKRAGDHDLFVNTRLCQQMRAVSVEPSKTPSFSSTIGFQEDLARIEEWFRHLPYQDAVLALQSIIASLPYPVSPSSLISGATMSQQYQQQHALAVTGPSSPTVHDYPIRSAVSTPALVHFEGLGDFQYFGSASTPASPTRRLTPQFGAIGQERPFSTPEHTDDEETRLAPRSTELQNVSKVWEAQQHRYSNLLTPPPETYQPGNQRRVYSVPQTKAPPSPPHTLLTGIQKSFPSHHQYIHQGHHYGQHYGRQQKQDTKGKIPDEVDFSLLNDIPAWFRSLRLHKYTHLFWPDPSHPESTPREWSYKEIIQLTDEELEKMGVGALGARRKMLRMFELVKEKLAEKEHGHDDGLKRMNGEAGGIVDVSDE